MLKISQEELAKSVGITFQQIQKYEKGANRISASRLFMLARYLKTSVSFFFEGFQDLIYNQRKVDNQMVLAEDSTKADYVAEKSHQINNKLHNLSTDIDELIVAFSHINDEGIRQNILKLVNSMGKRKKKS